MPNLKDALSVLKIAHHRDRIDAFRSGDIVFPITLIIHPVAACNHTCTFCRYQSFPQSVFNKTLVIKDMISVSKMSEILDDCIDMGVKAVNLAGGGEPSLHPDFLDILDKIIQRQFDLSLITNGCANAWARDGYRVADLLGQYATWVRFSINAGTPEMYETIHRSKASDFECVCDNVRYLCEIRSSAVNVGISFVVTKENWQEIPVAVELADSLGVDYIRFSTFMLPDSFFPPDYGEGFTPKLDYYSADLFGEICDLLQTVSPSKSLQIFDDFGLRGDFGRSYGNYESGDYCYYSDLACCVGSDLNIYPCCLWMYHPRGVIGSLKHDRLKDVWLGTDRQNFYSNFDIASECVSCFIKPKNDVVKYLVNEPEHVNFM